MTIQEIDRIIDLGLRENTPNEAIVCILSQLNQQPLRFSADEFNSDCVKNFSNRGEIFNNKSYYEAAPKDFDLYNEDGDLVLSITQSGKVIGHLPGFEVPSDNPEDIEAFREFARKLLAFDTITYPEKK